MATISSHRTHNGSGVFEPLLSPLPHSEPSLERSVAVDRFETAKPASIDLRAQFFGNGEWSAPIVDKDGVRIRKRVLENYPLPEYCVETEVNAPLSVVTAIFIDTKNTARWSNCKEAGDIVDIERDASGAWVGKTYIINGTPFGVDRISINQRSIRVYPAQQAVSISTESINEHGHVKKEITRVTRTQNETLLIARGPDKTQVMYRLAIDPNIIGTALAYWWAPERIDNFTANIAQNAMQSIRELVRDPIFADAIARVQRELYGSNVSLP
jgi:hypothetical protein